MSSSAPPERPRGLAIVRIQSSGGCRRRSDSVTIEAQSIGGSTTRTYSSWRSASSGSAITRVAATRYRTTGSSWSARPAARRQGMPALISRASSSSPISWVR